MKTTKKLLLGKMNTMEDFTRHAKTAFLNFDMLLDRANQLHAEIEILWETLEKRPYSFSFSEKKYLAELTKTMLVLNGMVNAAYVVVDAHFFEEELHDKH